MQRSFAKYKKEERKMKENKMFDLNYITPYNDFIMERHANEALFKEKETDKKSFFPNEAFDTIFNHEQSLEEPLETAPLNIQTGEDWYFEYVLNPKDILDTERQKELLYLYKNSNDKKEKEFALNELVQTNQRLIVFIAKTFKDSGVPLEDLIQEGNIGLIKAIEKYELSFGHALSTYATWWIRHSMLRSIQETKSLIRIPTHMYEKIHKLRLIMSTAYKEKKPRPTEEDLSVQLNCTVEQVWEIIRCASLVDLVSLSTPVTVKNGPDTEGMSELQDFVSSTELSPEEEYRKLEIAETILFEMKKTLSKRSFDIMCRRYGIGEYTVPQTLEVIGKSYGVTKERIRQVQCRAEKKLKTNPVLESLID